MPQPSHLPTTSANQRNILLAGYSSVGKSTLAATLVARTPGAQFQTCGQLTISTLPHRGQVLTLLDLPGHPDFVGFRRSALAAADGVLFVISAVHGIDGRTALLWRECAAANLSCAIAITHLDQPGADFERTVAGLTEHCGDDLTVLALPMHDLPDPRTISIGPSGDRVVGLIDLLSGSIHDYRQSTPLTATDEDWAAITEQREDLLADLTARCPDFELAERLLLDPPSDLEPWQSALYQATALAELYPVLPIGPTSAVGLPQLLDLLALGFPAPPVTAEGASARHPELIGLADCAPIAQILSIDADSAAVLLLAGELKAGHYSGVWQVGQQQSSRVEVTAPQELCPGEVGVVSLSSGQWQATLSWSQPERIPAALVPAPTRGYRLLGESAGELASWWASHGRLDPGAAYDMNSGVLWVQGPQHLALILTALGAQCGHPVTAEPIRSGYWHRVNQQVSVSLGPESGVVAEVRPAELGTPVELVPGLDPILSQALRHFAATGWSGGFPLTGVTLGGSRTLPGAASVTQQPEFSSTELFEQLDEVRIELDAEFLPELQAEILGRRGRMLDHSELPGGRVAMRAEVPAQALAGLAVDLRGLARGTGDFNRSPGSLRRVPDDLAARILAD